MRKGFQVIICHQPGYIMFPVVAPDDADIKVGDLVGIERDEPPSFVVDSVDLSREDYEVLGKHIVMAGEVDRIRTHARPMPLDYGTFEELEEEEDEQSGVSCETD